MENLRSTIFYSFITIIAVLLYGSTYNLEKDLTLEETNWMTFYCFSKYFSYPVCNDSFDQITLTQNPGMVLESYRNSRPLLFFLIWPFCTLGTWIISFFASIIGFETNTIDLGYYVTWLSYIILNFILIISSGILLEKGLEDDGQNPLSLRWRLAVFTIIIFEPVVKISVFSAIYQVFQVFMPISSILILSHVIKNFKFLTPRYFITLGIGISLMILVYASYFITFLALFTYLLTQAFKNFLNTKEISFTTTKYLRTCLSFSIGIMIPMTTWLISVNFVQDNLEIQEMNENWKMFVWLIDAGREGMIPFFTEVGIKLHAFTYILWDQSKITLISLSLIFIWSKVCGIGFKDLIYKFIENPFNNSLLILLFFTLLFWFSGGLYVWRYFRPIEFILAIILFQISFIILRNSIKNSHKWGVGLIVGIYVSIYSARTTLYVDLPMRYHHYFELMN